MAERGAPGKAQKQDQDGADRQPVSDVSRAPKKAQKQDEDGTDILPTAGRMMAWRYPDPPRTRPIWVRVDEACRLSGIGKTKLYQLVAAGRVLTTTVGRRRLVAVASIEALGDD